MSRRKTSPLTVALCAIAALTTGCAVDTYRIVSSDKVPSVDLSNGNDVCADEGINSIAANEIEFWLHSSADAGLDRRITAALKVSIKTSEASFHLYTTTTCESNGARIAFVRTDGSITGRASLRVPVSGADAPDAEGYRRLLGQEGTS